MRRASSRSRSTRGPAAEASTRRPPAALWRTLQRIFTLSRPYRLRLYTAMALTLAASAIWLVVPLGLRSLLDAVFVEANGRLLDRMALGLVVLFLVQALVGFGGRYLLEWTGERIVADLRQRLYAHLNRLDFRFFANQRTGDLTSRLTNDVSSVRNAVTNALVDLLTQALTLAGSVVLMVTLNWRLSLIIFAVVPPRRWPRGTSGGRSACSPAPSRIAWPTRRPSPRKRSWPCAW